MEFTASPTDVIQAVRTARQIEANPLALAGRLVGLSGADIERGVPGWAWCVLAFGAGALTVHQIARQRGIRAVE